MKIDSLKVTNVFVRPFEIQLVLLSGHLGKEIKNRKKRSDLVTFFVILFLHSYEGNCDF